MQSIRHEFLRRVLAAAACSAWLAGTAAWAAEIGSGDGPVLIEARKCYACHGLSDTLLGPPFQAIAAMHGEGGEVMVDILARKIIRGGAGNWGVVPMVPNPQVSEDEARTIVRWILEQKP